MDDDCCEMLRCCCECGLCLGLCCLCCKNNDSHQQQNPYYASVIICIILFSICGWCCKRKREGTVYGYGPSNVTVTTQPATGPQQPYPVHHYGGGGTTPNYQTNPPQSGPYMGPSYPASVIPGVGPYPPGPAIGGGPPYPAGVPGIGPYPLPSAGPYPPQAGGYQQQPPSYDMAMGQPPVNPPNPMMEAYAKQAPYNPNFRG